MADVTFVVPVGPAHTALLDRALDSIKAQTVPAEVVVIHDEQGRGPGWARNVGLAQVFTSFVSFLDADDWLEPTFVEHTLATWVRNAYVYTDWWEDASVKVAPVCPWTEASWHVLTTLIPTISAQAIGFDETLAGGEDSLFYNQLVRGEGGLCGHHLPEPLFHYSADGTRARSFINTPAHKSLITQIQDIRRSVPMSDSCCGPNISLPLSPIEGLAGDVLVEAAWLGNRQQRGPVSNRMYPRSGNGRQMMVDPRDVQARPDLWRPARQAVPPITSLDGLAFAMRPGIQPPPPAQAPKATAPAPNFSKASALYNNKATG